MQQLALILLESAAVPKVGAHSKALHWKKEAKAMNLKVSTVTHGARNSFLCCISRESNSTEGYFALQGGLGTLWW